MSEPSWDEQIAGRIAFDSYRLHVGRSIVPWDWAWPVWQRQRWMDYAKTDPESGSRPPSLRRGN